MKKIFLLAIASIGIANTTNAQISAGVMAGYQVMNAYNKPLAGLTFGYDKNEKLAFKANLYTVLPLKEVISTSLTPISPLGSPISVDRTNKLNVYGLQVLTKYYFGSEREYAAGGFNVVGGISALYYNSTSKLADFDATKYKDEDQITNQSGLQPYITLGAGYEIKLNSKMYIAPEVSYNLAANQANDQAIYISLPSNLLINVAFRYYFSDPEDN